MPVTVKRLRELVKTFPWEAWNQELAPKLSQHYRDLVILTGKKTAEEHIDAFDQNDPFLERWMTDYVGERIVSLSRTSQKEVTRVLRKAFAGNKDLSAGELQTQLLDAVRDKYEDFETYRALMIARSESAIAYNHGGVLGSAQAGFKKVDVLDGTDDEECRSANGAVWSITKALNNPIGHPNCVRAFSPHVEDDDAEDDD